ncbi:unnamed protein product [Prunus armeniaca]|uniref:Uncharacterized protein n=1 Tax=Prunus armeniaca TaxID=36596 RepID=A0A6J5TIN8_PRUAR|nr:unnamed protein product [Prunus armeniaca]
MVDEMNSLHVDVSSIFPSLHVPSSFSATSSSGCGGRKISFGDGVQEVQQASYSIPFGVWTWGLGRGKGLEWGWGLGCD